LEYHSRFSTTTDCIRSLSHLRDDFDFWNFLYPKPALNLIATLPMRHAAIGNAIPSKIPRIPPVIDARRAAIVYFCDNQEA
jgi:hypothetical protein